MQCGYNIQLHRNVLHFIPNALSNHNFLTSSKVPTHLKNNFNIKTKESLECKISLLVQCGHNITFDYNILHFIPDALWKHNSLTLNKVPTPFWKNNSNVQTKKTTKMLIFIANAVWTQHRTSSPMSCNITTLSCQMDLPHISEKRTQISK